MILALHGYRQQENLIADGSGSGIIAIVLSKAPTGSEALSVHRSVLSSWGD